MKRTVVVLIAMALSLGVAHALRSNNAMELLAINDEIALIDTSSDSCGQLRKTWIVVDLATGQTRELIRQQEDGKLEKSCAAVTAELEAIVKRHNLDGVVLDASSCGKRDATWWMTAQALLDPGFGGKWSLDPRAPNLTKLTKARVAQTALALAKGPFNSPRWKATTKGTETALILDGTPIATLPALRAEDEHGGGSPWVAIAPNRRSLVVGDPDSMRVTVYAIDAGRATPRLPTKAR